VILSANILALAGLAIIGFKLSSKSEIIRFYWPGLSLKIIAGIALGLIYSYYYTSGDSWVMFNESVRIANTAFTSTESFIDIYFASDYTAIPNYPYSIRPRPAFMTKILAPLVVITSHNYWLSACYLSLFSFFGFWLAANTIYRIFTSTITAVLPTLFFPSIIFWSSGVLKDSIAMGSLLGVMAILINIYYKKRVSWLNLIALIIGLFFLINLKYYYAATLIVAFATIFFSRFILRGKRNWYIELGAMLLLFISILGIASMLHPNFWPSRFLKVITDNYYQFIAHSATENIVSFNNLSPTIASFLIYSPKALFAGLFYPLWSPLFSWLKIAAVLENWFLLLSFIYGIQYFKLPVLRDNRILFFGMAMFVLTSAIFITFSTPNLGTLVRFKIGYLVVFVIMIVALITRRAKTV